MVHIGEIVIKCSSCLLQEPRLTTGSGAIKSEKKPWEAQAGRREGLSAGDRQSPWVWRECGLATEHLGRATGDVTRLHGNAETKSWVQGVLSWQRMLGRCPTSKMRNCRAGRCRDFSKTLAQAKMEKEWRNIVKIFFYLGSLGVCNRVQLPWEKWLPIVIFTHSCPFECMNWSSHLSFLQLLLSSS
jgi:hypothetical protein